MHILTSFLFFAGAALGTAMGTGHANGLGYGQGGKRGKTEISKVNNVHLMYFVDQVSIDQVTILSNKEQLQRSRLFDFFFYLSLTVDSLFVNYTVFNLTSQVMALAWALCQVSSDRFL